MKPQTSQQPAERAPLSGRSGFVLVLVLCFIVLLTGLVVAFFSRAAIDRQMSNASANGTKTSLFASGAVDSIVCELQQEIAASSTLTTITASGSTFTIYAPKGTGQPFNQTFSPCRNTGSNSDSLPNLVKISTSERGLYGNFTSAYENAGVFASNAPVRASICSSTTSSLNGRSINAARWNKALLLPKKNTNGTDLTPTDQFTPPTWIYVTRSGSNPGTASFDTAYKTTSGTNDSAIVGRYAYAIYNEGGLLDMNVAGYPTESGTTFDYIKPGLAYADLHQIPGISDLDSSTQDQVINAIVGWRNYASGSTQGTFPDFTSISGSAYYDAVVKNCTGFLAVNSGSLNGNGTDQAFTSRQQLVDLVTVLGGSDTTKLANLQNALQYMGTFSRDLSQPSFYPNPNRPKIKVSSYSGGIASCASGVTIQYKGNLFGGQDVTGTTYLADPSAGINPAFLYVRAQADFTRANGSTGSKGEPLVKQRFLLKRLAWLTYKGPSASRSMSDPDMSLLQEKYGITREFLNQGTAANILNYFGLKWNAGTTDSSNGCNGGFWTYEHLATSSTNANETILTLSEIAAKGSSAYEPDFFQLLKAAIHVGALGKTAMNGTNQHQWYGVGDPAGSRSAYNLPDNSSLQQQTIHDCNPDYQIFQIGANIIDQFDVDGFPTQIRIGTTADSYQQFRGVEDQPYINAIYHALFPARSFNFKVQTYTCSNSSGKITVTATNNTTYNLGNIPTSSAFALRSASSDTTALGYYNGYTGVATFNDTGLGIGMAIPAIWNPHDKYNPLPSASDGLRPTKFRIAAYSGVPLQQFAAGCTTSGTSYSYYAQEYTYGFPRLYVGGTNWVSTTGTGGIASTFFVNNGSKTWFTSIRNALGSGSGALDFSVDGKTARSVSNSGYGEVKTILNGTNAAITFEVPDVSASSSSYAFETYREPTLLFMKSKTSDARNIAMASANWTVINSGSISGVNEDGIKLCESGTLVTPADYQRLLPDQSSDAPPKDQAYIGIPLGAFPQVFAVTTSGFVVVNSSTISVPATKAIMLADSQLGGISTPVAFALQYQNSGGAWVTYDVKSTDFIAGRHSTRSLGEMNLSNPYSKPGFFADPRTARFGAQFVEYDLYCAPPAWGTGSACSLPWINVQKGVLTSMRPDAAMGFAWGQLAWDGNSTAYTVQSRDPGWTGWQSGRFFSVPFGMFSQNSIGNPSDAARYLGDSFSYVPNYPTFYTDADGVLRRAMGGLATPATSSATASTIGLPMARAEAYSNSGGNPASPQTRDAVPVYQYQSRPMVLNRPFRSVGELGYVFSDLPWRNLDFTFPESPFKALLDVFTVQEINRADALSAGKVDLNTRNPAVIKAILKGAYTDEQAQFSTAVAGSRSPLNANISGYIADAFVARTGTSGTTGISGTNALTNLSELVGKCVSGTAKIPSSRLSSSVLYLDTTNMAYLGGSGTSGEAACYTGFSEDLTTILDNIQAATFADSSDSTGTYNKQAMMNISRFRESTVRALANAGTTRVWNLMIDIVAQTGRFPNNSTANDWSKFYVEGEKRYWVHLAIDRLTGEILDKQTEPVDE